MSDKAQTMTDKSKTTAVAARRVLQCADLFRQGCTNAGAMIGMSDDPTECVPCTLDFLCAIKEAVKDVQT